MFEVEASPSAESFAVLSEWLRPRIGADSLTIEGHARPPSGNSNETHIIRASWSVAGETRVGGFVIRQAPKGFALYHSYDLEAQYRTIEQVLTTDVPAPPLVGYEPDPSVIGEPFYVMYEVDGMAPPDLPPLTATGWVLESAPEDQARLYRASVEMMARIHRIELDSIDVSFLNQTCSATGFEDQLRRAESWYHWAAGDRRQPTMSVVLDWLLDNRPSSPPPECLNWGDARIGNMLFRSYEPVAVLDWEQAGVGPAEVDLGWWVFMNRFYSRGMGYDPLPGFPDDAATVEMYEEALGRRVKDLLYYDVFGGFRMGIIFIRGTRRGAQGAPAASVSEHEINNGTTRLLAELLDLPSPATLV